MSDSIQVGPQGRIVIPVALRRQLHLRSGDELVAHAEDGRLVLETREAALRRLHGKFAHVDPGRSLVDELLAERRAEAQREKA